MHTACCSAYCCLYISYLYVCVTDTWLTSSVLVHSSSTVPVTVSNLDERCCCTAVVCMEDGSLFSFFLILPYTLTTAAPARGYICSSACRCVQEQQHAKKPGSNDRTHTKLMLLYDTYKQLHRAVVYPFLPPFCPPPKHTHAYYMYIHKYICLVISKVDGDKTAVAVYNPHLHLYIYLTGISDNSCCCSFCCRRRDDG